MSGVTEPAPGQDQPQEMRNQFLWEPPWNGPEVGREGDISQLRVRENISNILPTSLRPVQLGGSGGEIRTEVNPPHHDHFILGQPTLHWV